MGLFDFGSNNNAQGQGQGQSAGLLGDLDPASRMMVAMSILNKFTGNNRGSESGFGDVFGLMMQQQQLRRQAEQDALSRERFGLEKQRFSMDQKQYDAMMAKAKREADAAAAAQSQLNSAADGVINYQAPGGQLDPVIPEYEQPQAPMQEPQDVGMGMPGQSALLQSMPNPMGQQQPFLIPSKNYLNNTFAAADKARANPSVGAFVDDPQVRAQAAALIRSGEPQLVKQGYDLLQNGGSFTLGPGQVRKTGTGQLIGDNPAAPQYNKPVAVLDKNGKYKLVQFNNQGGSRPVEDYAPIPKSGTIVRDANGNVLFEQGGWAAGSSATPTSATQTELQKDVISGEQTLNNLDALAKNYKAEYLTYPGQARAWVARQTGKLTGKSGDKEYLQGYTKFVNGAEQAFNQYRKEITGAAAAIQELDRLKQSMMNKDMAPEEFEAAFAQFKDIGTRALQLKQKFIRQGIPANSPQMGQMIDAELFNAQQSTTQPNEINQPQMGANQPGSNYQPQVNTSQGQPQPPSTTSKYTPQQLDKMAQEAIAQGRDPQAVQQMMQQLRGQ